MQIDQGQQAAPGIAALLDASAHGKTKMELCHHHGGGRLLFDLLDAHAHGESKTELCHHHGF